MPDLTDSMGVTGDFGKYQIVYVDPAQSAHDLFDTLIHEGVHVFQHMVEYMGEEKPSKEMEAYCIGFIGSTLLKEFIRLTEPIKEKTLAIHEGREAGLCP